MNDLIKNTAYITVAQIVFILSGYVIHFGLARMLDPSLYGMLGIILAFQSTINILLTSGIAAATSKFTSEKQIAIKKIILFQLFISIIISALYIALSGQISLFLKNDQLKAYIPISALVFPLYAVYAVTTSHLNGRKLFRQQSFASIAYSIAKIASVFALAFFFSLKGAIIGYAIAALAGIIIAARSISNKGNTPMKRIIDYAIPITIYSLLITLFQSVDLLLLQRITQDSAKAGYYTAALNIAKIPTFLLAGFSTVIFPLVSSNDKQSEIHIKKSLKYLMIVLIPITIAIFADASSIVKLFYPSSYQQASQPLSILILAYSIFTLFAFFNTILNAVYKQKTTALIGIAIILLSVLLNHLLIPIYDIKGAAFATLLSALFGFAASFISTKKLYKIFSFNLLLKFLTASSLMLSLSLIIKVDLLLLPVKYAIALTAYFGVLIWLKVFSIPEMPKINLQIVAKIVLLLYTAAVLLASILSPKIFQNIFALIFIPAVAAGLILFNEKFKFNLSKGYVYALVAISFFIAIALRSIPYIRNPIPLGYDTGIYKYVFEKYMTNLPDIPEKQLENWIRSSHEQGLFVLADLLYIFGFSTNHLLIPLLILFSSISIFPLYMLAKKHFNPTIAVIACIIFALSYTQLATFSYMYYKNIIAITTMLLFFVFIDKNQFLAVIFATATGFYHRPTFLILAIVWITNSIAKKRFYLKSMIITAFLLMLIYLPRFNMIIIDTFSSLIKNISSPTSGGTFFSPTYFRIVSLAYLPFAFHFMIKQKKINLLFIWAFVSGVIIFAELFFFNRFLTNFDLAISILAAAGIYHIILPIKENHIKLSILVVLILSSAWFALSYAKTARPLLNENEVSSIKNGSSATKPDSYIIIPSSYYSPWILGYSERKAIAPGIFEYNKWSFDQWQKYWSSSSFEEIKPLLDAYEKPLYIFIAKQRNNIQYMEKFNNSCFTNAYDDDFHRIIEYVC